jgi:hypothetical protein
LIAYFAVENWKCRSVSCAVRPIRALVCAQKQFEHFRLAHPAAHPAREFAPSEERQAKNGMRTMNMMIEKRSVAIKLPTAARNTGAHRAAAPIVCRPRQAFPR